MHTNHDIAAPCAMPDYPICPISRLRAAIVAGDRITARDTADLLAEAFSDDLPPAHVIAAMEG